MPRSSRAPGAALPFALWNELALRTGEMLLASAQVIGHRTHRMAKAGHNPGLRDRRAFSRMGLETVEAAGEALWAMGPQLTAATPQLAVRAWPGAAAGGPAW